MSDDPIPDNDLTVNVSSPDDGAGRNEGAAASLSRREFLVGLGVAVAAGPALLTSVAARPGGAEGRARAAADQPNIVIIITDQERYPQHWPSGWSEANLPNRKRLADTGISFTHAFCNTCMCSPSRSTLVTGLYPARHGVIDTLVDSGEYSALDSVLPTDTQNMARMLKSAGYNVVYKGKWHLSKPLHGSEFTPEDAALYGFDGWDPPDAGEDTDVEHFGGGRADNDGRFAGDAVNFLAEVDPAKPFALIVSLVNPHDLLAYPGSWSQDYSSGEFEQGIELPPTVDEDLSTKPSCQKTFVQRTPLRLGALTTEAQKRTYVNFYAYLHKVVDARIGMIIDALEAPRGLNGKEPSLRDRTIVIRTADHGEMGLSHGGMRQKAFNVYEESIRIPLVISNPVLFPAPVVTGSLASLVDLMPTIATMAKVDKSGWEFQGNDLSPILSSPAATVQDAIHFTYDDQRAGSGMVREAVPQPNHIRCLRDDRWKYAIYFDPAGAEESEYEMYDLSVDPLETNNLARSTDPAVVSQREALHERLTAMMIEKGTLPPVLSDVPLEGPLKGSAGSGELLSFRVDAAGAAVVVRFRLAAPSPEASVTIVDSIGRRLDERRFTGLEAGEHQASFPIRHRRVAYFCMVRAGSFRATGKCIVAR